MGWGRKMSTILMDYYLIKSVDIAAYCAKNKQQISDRLSKPDIMFDFSRISESIFLYFEDNVPVDEIQKLVVRQKLRSDMLERFSKDMLPILSDNAILGSVFVKKVEAECIKDSGYMIVADKFHVLEPLYLGNMCAHTGTDVWVDSYVDAIEKYNLFLPMKDEDDYDVAYRLMRNIESGNERYPCEIIELYSPEQFYNFLEQNVIWGMVKRGINRQFEIYDKHIKSK